MTITNGTRLFHYEILAWLVRAGWAKSGAPTTRGSTARAIKVLPASFTNDADENDKSQASGKRSTTQSELTRNHPLSRVHDNNHNRAFDHHLPASQDFTPADRYNDADRSAMRPKLSG